MKRYFLIGFALLLIAFFATGFYYQSKEKERQERSYVEISDNEIAPLIENYKLDFETNVEEIKNANVISDDLYDNFHAISKLYTIDSGNVVWTDVELFNSDKNKNIDIITGICTELSTNLITQDVSALMINFKYKDADLVSFTYMRENENYKDPMIIWNDPEYEKLYN